MIIVPIIISKTFQLIVDTSLFKGNMPETRKTAAAVKAYNGLYFGLTIIKTYINKNRIRDNSFTNATSMCLNSFAANYERRVICSSFSL